MRRALAVLALCTLSCGAAKTPPPAIETVPAEPPKSTTKNSSDHLVSPGAEPRSADEVVARALADVALRRELPAKGPVKGKTISRDEMVAHVRDQIHSEIPKDVMDAQNELLFSIGVVPADFDYEASILVLMGSELAGFYEPKDKTMYLAEDLVGMEAHATLAHELVHALQDQHYDLGKRIKFREDATDEQSAVHALAEGDATSAMLDEMLAVQGRTALDLPEDMIGMETRGSMAVAPGSASVPGLIKRSVIAPYVDGVRFVHWGRRRGGWAEVDRIWQSPPTTTEQLLHPKKYLAHEAGVDVKVPPAPAGGPKQVIYRDIQGEESVRLLFEEWMPRRTAETAATGWGGDRVAVFREGGNVAMAWHLRYDDEASAKEGLVAMARGVLKTTEQDPRSPFVSRAQAEKKLRQNGVCRERKEAGPFAVVRRGKDLALVAGPYHRQGSQVKAASTCSKALAWARAIAAT
ncbi:MAG: hypothetical protein KC776_18205 [Myxococcales bacterium]|nr:hypothetical protein [Myxococcales bacterium]